MARPNSDVNDQLVPFRRFTSPSPILVSESVVVPNLRLQQPQWSASLGHFFPAHIVLLSVRSTSKEQPFHVPLSRQIPHLPHPRVPISGTAASSFRWTLFFVLISCLSGVFPVPTTCPNFPKSRHDWHRWYVLFSLFPCSFSDKRIGKATEN